MEKTYLMSKDDIWVFTYSVDEGNWLESTPPTTANAPVCKCGCGEIYAYDAFHNWEPFCANN